MLQRSHCSTDSKCYSLFAIHNTTFSNKRALGSSVFCRWFPNGPSSFNQFLLSYHFLTSYIANAITKAPDSGIQSGQLLKWTPKNFIIKSWFLRSFSTSDDFRKKSLWHFTSKYCEIEIHLENHVLMKSVGVHFEELSLLNSAEWCFVIRVTSYSHQHFDTMVTSSPSW